MSACTAPWWAHDKAWKEVHDAEDRSAAPDTDVEGVDVPESKWSVTFSDDHMGGRTFFLIKREPGKQSIYAKIPYESYADELLAQLQMAEVYNAAVVRHMDVGGGGEDG